MNAPIPMRMVCSVFALTAALGVDATPTTPTPTAYPLSTPTAGPTARRAHFHHHAAAVGRGPQRIVSLSPAVTETLFAVGASARVVAVTRFCDRPAAAKALPQVGGYTDASLEAILAASPDLVIAQPSLQQRSLLDRLVERGIPALVVFADSIAESEDMMRAVGSVVGADDAASALVHRQRQVLGQASASPGKSRVLVVVGTDPLVVAGRGSFGDDAVRALGYVSAIADDDPAWPSWSLESVLHRRVDVVVAAEGPAARLRLEQLFSPLGVRRPRVVVADRAILMRPGPSLADDVARLDALLTRAGSPAGAQATP
jgi:iron complex transport system substrate-binding protein